MSKSLNANQLQLTDYLATLNRNLGIEVQNTTKIYLDTKFWILLRDRKTKDTQNLYDLLCLLVKHRKIICPINRPIIEEVLRQQDTSSRKKTISILDELGKGLSIIPEYDRIISEISAFIISSENPNNEINLDRLVWTKCVFFYCNYLYMDKSLPFPLTFENKKSFIAYCWNLTLDKLLPFLQEIDLSRTDYVALTNKLNDNFKIYDHEIKSYSNAYLNEMRGIIDLVVSEKFCRVIFSKINQLNKQAPTDLNDEQITRITNSFKNACAIGLKKNKAQSTLRTIEILANLHATYRWDRNKTFKPNDLNDIEHAAAAIGYCDAFFTEKSLAHMANSRSNSISKQYNCYVTSNPLEALNFLRKL